MSEGFNDSLFRRLCDSCGVGLLTLDEHNRVAYCNKQVCSLLNRREEDIIAQPIGPLFDSAKGGVFEHYAAQAREQGCHADFELRYLREVGSPQIIAVTVSPIVHDGSPSQFVSVCLRDITHRMHLQDRLGQDQKMHALGAMAGNIAHHFNNILGGLVTGIDFARGSSDARVLRRTLNAAAHTLQRATALLNGLLAFAEADYSDADMADLTETFFSFVESIEQELAEAQVELDLKISAIPVIAVPRNQFLTVLRNLLDNALDAMPRGGRIVLTLTPGNGYVVCRVADSGGGISREDLERVFEPFYSTKDGESHEAVGQHPGLGLSVVRGIIHEMGGEILISSKPGVTAIEIRLPIDPRKPLRKVGISDYADLLGLNAGKITHRVR